MRGEPLLVTLTRPWHLLCLFVCRLLPRAVALGGRCGPDLPQPFRGSSWRDAPGLWNGLRSHPHPHQAATGWSGRTSPGTWSCSCHRGDACPGDRRGAGCPCGDGTKSRACHEGHRETVGSKPASTR